MHFEANSDLCRKMGASGQQCSKAKNITDPNALPRLLFALKL
jgi:hypothetical protein